MSSNFQSHIIEGNLGSDPETTTLDSGTTVCKFRVAVNRRYKDNETTQWYTIEVWGKLGEICQEWLTKGRNVIVYADRLETYAYMHEESGEARASVQLTARDVRFLGSVDDTPKAAKEKDEIPW